LDFLRDRQLYITLIRKSSICVLEEKVVVVFQNIHCYIHVAACYHFIGQEMCMLHWDVCIPLPVEYQHRAADMMGSWQGVVLNEGFAPGFFLALGYPFLNFLSMHLQFAERVCNDQLESFPHSPCHGFAGVSLLLKQPPGRSSAC